MVAKLWELRRRYLQDLSESCTLQGVGGKGSRRNKLFVHAMPRREMWANALAVSNGFVVLMCNSLPFDDRFVLGGHPGPFELCGYGLGSRSVLEKCVFLGAHTSHHMAGSVDKVVRACICQLVVYWILLWLMSLAFSILSPRPFPWLDCKPLQLWGSWELYCPKKLQ